MSATVHLPWHTGGAYVEPVLHVEPLATMDDRADTRELGCAPVLGVKLTDYDCCTTEAWCVVGPALDDDVLLVEVIEARPIYYDVIEWRVYDSEVVTSIDMAVAMTVAMTEDYRCGVRCTCP
jgi:hypothetical protein